MDTFRLTQLEGIQKRLSYRFRDASLLDEALTHSSYVKGDGKADRHNERLEFLGDAVLELCVSEFLYRNYQGMDEGAMTRLRALAVYEPALCRTARELGLGPALLLSRGEEHSGGREKPSILADAAEAVIGAVYLDGGIQPASRIILHFAADVIREAAGRASSKDDKTRLQEYVQKHHLGGVRYVLAESSGPDHRRTFRMQAVVQNRVMGEGVGASKQEAGQKAAREALLRLGASKQDPLCEKE